MKLQRLKRYFLLFLFILFNSPSYSAELKINFFDTFDEKYMLELVQELKYEDNIKRIKAILDEKQWIERYEIKRNFFSPSSINIFPRKPIFLWNDNSYVDKNFVLFQKNENSISTNILKVNCPKSLLKDIFEWVNDPAIEVTNSLISIKYNSVEGWIFQYEKFKAKLGKDLDTHKLKNLSKTIEYLYAKTKNPSIVDLRSDAGIALKYDK